jgi:density-regulated protein
MIDCGLKVPLPPPKSSLGDRTVLIRIWQTDALAAATSTLSLDAQKRAEKDAHKKALKQAATIASSKVIIKRVERNKVR